MSSVGEIAFLGALSLTLINPEQEFVADDAAVAGGNGMMLALGGVAFGLLGAALGALGGRKLVGGR